jgi:hypothetical protein
MMEAQPALQPIDSRSAPGTNGGAHSHTIIVVEK